MTRFEFLKSIGIIDNDTSEKSLINDLVNANYWPPQHRSDIFVRQIIVLVAGVPGLKVR